MYLMHDDNKIYMSMAVIFPYTDCICLLFIQLCIYDLPPP